MSDLFMNMQRRRLTQTPTAVGDLTSISSRSSSVQSTQVDRLKASVEESSDDDSLSNILSLKLKKPKHWKWELTTSRSCSNIALPRILLYDHKGELLVDVNTQAEQTYKPAENLTYSPLCNQSRKRSCRAATTSLEGSIRQTLDSDFNSLQIQEATPSPEPISLSIPSQQPYSAVDTPPLLLYTNKLPDYKLERRSSSLKSVRFQGMEDSSSNNNNSAKNSKGSNASTLPIVDLPTPPSTITTTTTGTSSSSGPREKRRYRRSHSSGRSPAHSESILERLSFSRGRFSSPEYGQEEEVYQAPRYFLRTSKAGTLVIQEESFSRCRRRRQKHSSSENPRSGTPIKARSTTSLNSNTDIVRRDSREVHREHMITEARGRRRRRMSSGTRNHRAQLSTSEEEVKQARQQQEQQLTNIVTNEHAHEFEMQERKYPSFSRQNKADLVTMESESALLHTFDCATAR